MHVSPLLFVPGMLEVMQLRSKSIEYVFPLFGGGVKGRGKPKWQYNVVG